MLQSEGIESHVVDPASIATSRRRRRAKTDKIDGEALIRALLAYKRGEPRVCAMVKAPTCREEDDRRICRERSVLTAERVAHVNRIKGLLFGQGISDYEPMHRCRRARLDELKTGDPGGRTGSTAGLKSRVLEWSRPPEPRPPHAGYWCSRYARRPNVSLNWCRKRARSSNGLRPWIANNHRRFAHDAVTSNMKP